MPLSRHLARPLLSLTLLLGVAPVAAITAERPPNLDSGDFFALLAAEEEETTATRYPQAIERAPSAVTVITRDEIQASGVVNLADLLREVAGVNVWTINGGQTQVGIHGTDVMQSSKLLILIDGHPVRDPLFGANVFNQLPVVLEEIERVEVVRTPGTTYGANAVTGVIHIITRRPRESTDAPYLTVTRGENDTTVLAGGGGIAHGRKALSVAWRNFDTTAWNENLDEESDRHSAWQLRGEVDLKAGPRLSVAAGESDFTGFMRFPFRLCKHLIRSDARYLDATLSDHLAGGTEWRLTLSLSNRELTLMDNGAFTRVEIEPHPELTHFEPAATLELNGQVGRLHWVGGGEVREVVADSSTMLDGDLDEPVGALYGQGEWEVRRNLSWFAGLRADTHYDANPVLSPFTALVWLPHPRHTLRLSVNLAHRFPNLYEGRLDYVQEGGNPLKAGRYEGDRDLDPEEVTTYEVGYRAQLAPTFTVGFTAYIAESRDNIQMRFVDNFTAADGRTLPHYRYANINDQRTLGWDAEARWRPTPVWRLFATASQARVQVEGEDLIGEHVLPDLTATAGIGYRPVAGPFGRIALHWVGPSDWRLPFYNDTTHQIVAVDSHLASYTTVDVNVGTTLWDGRLVADLTFTNLLRDHHREWVINEIDSRAVGRLIVRF